MEQPFHTGGLGTNHTEIVLHLNNSLGQVGLVTKVVYIPIQSDHNTL